MSAPYEEPENAEVVIRSGEQGVEEAVKVILRYLDEAGLLKLKRVEEGQGG